MRVVALRAGLALSMAWPCLAQAQDALYGKQPPPGSTYIRIVSALAGPVAVTTNFHADRRIGTSPADRAGSYVVVERAAGRALAIHADAAGVRGDLEFRVAPDAYVTVALRLAGDGRMAIGPVVDRLDFNQNRTRIAFYNLMPGCDAASLILDPGGPAVFRDVGEGATSSRTVTPVEASVHAVCGTTAGPALTLTGLEVGSSYSIWSTPGGLTLTTDVLAAYRP